MNWTIPVDNLPQKVREIKVGPYTLANELEKIQKLQGQECPDLIALIAGRVVERVIKNAISDTQLFKSGRKAPKETYVMLEMLYLYGEIDDGSRASANTLRLFSNDARHLEDDNRIDIEHEATIVGLLQLFIEWYVCKFSHRPNKDQQIILPGHEWSNNGILRRLAIGGVDKFNFTKDEVEYLLGNSSLAGFAGERLIDCRSDLADDFTNRAFEKYHNSSRRVVEMRALFLSRNGNEKKALAFAKTNLEKVLSKFKYYYDPDSFGILGGVYKNYWLKYSDNESLEKAHEWYCKGSKEFNDNCYLRINVAATALWLGKTKEAVGQAEEVLNQLQYYHADHKILNYWLAATLAEANFLAGNHSIALDLYKQARELDKTVGRWKKTHQQLGIHLNMMGQQQLKNIYLELNRV